MPVKTQEFYSTRITTTPGHYALE